jgi:hypothetical protein
MSSPGCCLIPFVRGPRHRGLGQRADGSLPGKFRATPQAHPAEPPGTGPEGGPPAVCSAWVPESGLTALTCCFVTDGAGHDAGRGFAIGLPDVLQTPRLGWSCSLDPNGRRRSRSRSCATNSPSCNDALQERAVVVHPTPHDRVDPACEVGRGEIGAPVQPPGPHLGTHLRQGV